MSEFTIDFTDIEYDLMLDVFTRNDVALILWQ